MVVMAFEWRRKIGLPSNLESSVMDALTDSLVTHLLYVAWSCQPWCEYTEYIWNRTKYACGLLRGWPFPVVLEAERLEAALCSPQLQETLTMMNPDHYQDLHILAARVRDFDCDSQRITRGPFLSSASISMEPSKRSKRKFAI